MDSQGRRTMRREIKRQLADQGEAAPSPSPLPTETVPKTSLLKRIVGWEGISFVFLSGIGLALVGIDEFDWARIFFVLAATMLATKLAMDVRTAVVAHRFIIAVLAAIVAGVGANHINHWVTEKEISKSGMRQISTIVMVNKNSGLNSADVAKLVLAGLPKSSRHTHLEYKISDVIGQGYTPLLPYHVGELPSQNLGVSNAGEFSILDADSRIALVMVSIKDINKGDGEDLLKKVPREKVNSNCPTITPHVENTCYKTYSLATALTQDDVDKLNSDAMAICAVGKTTWRDETGTYQTMLNGCRLTDNWHFPPSHLKEVKLEAPKRAK